MNCEPWSFCQFSTIFTGFSAVLEKIFCHGKNLTLTTNDEIANIKSYSEEGTNFWLLTIICIIS